jgi:peptidoglycan glycosyltransferase
MSRRLGAMGTLMLLLFAILIGTSGYLQYWHASALNKSVLNPRLAAASQSSPRGDILASDGTVLAHSVPSGDSYFPWKREYPLGRLMSGVVGFTAAHYGPWALEAQYDSELSSHQQPAQSFSQVIAPISSANSLQITLQPALQRVAALSLAGRDGAVVALDPKTGAILAMYSNPTYDPSRITTTNYAIEAAVWQSYNKNDGHGFPPLGNLAIQRTFPPGSTFKVVTTASAVSNNPALMTKSYPEIICTPLPTTVNQLCNDGGVKCGGTVQVMLPYSCDPGYGLMGLDLGGDFLSQTAQSFGYNRTIPVDLPGLANSFFPSAATFVGDLPQLAYSAIGQENVRATALQNALVASAIADNGTIMTPHFLDQILSADGKTIRRYQPRPWLQPLNSLQTSAIVPLMEGVAAYGTAGGVGFLPQDDVAAKTGTAQTGNSAHNTDDWMIAFAPAHNPVIAIAVVVPFQQIFNYGATVAGPIVKCMVEAEIAIRAGLRATGSSTTCHF